MRTAIPFRSVNVQGAPGYDPCLQRHHLLPRQILKSPAFSRMFDAIGRHCIGFEDFRVNGMLLPAREERAIRMRLPLHRGPHRHYNQMVIERVGQIERDWSGVQAHSGWTARADAAMRLSLLRRALRRLLLASIGRHVLLNSRDPRGELVDFSDLDAMADTLWGATDGVAWTARR